MLRRDWSLLEYHCGLWPFYWSAVRGLWCRLEPEIEPSRANCFVLCEEINDVFHYLCWFQRRQKNVQRFHGLWRLLWKELLMMYACFESIVRGRCEQLSFSTQQEIFDDHENVNSLRVVRTSLKMLENSVLFWSIVSGGGRGTKLLSTYATTWKSSEHFNRPEVLVYSEH